MSGSNRKGLLRFEFLIDCAGHEIIRRLRRWQLRCNPVPQLAIVADELSIAPDPAQCTRERAIAIAIPRFLVVLTTRDENDMCFHFRLFRASRPALNSP